MTDALVTTIDLIRHGEPVGGRKYRGWRDDPLSEKGWAQMRAAIGDHRPWQVIVSSTLCRCADFARELAGRLDVPLELDEHLMEVGYGEWEGRTADELHAREPGIVRRLWRDPVVFRPPGAECLMQFRDRVMGAWDRVLARHHGKHILIVGHAGVIRMVLRHVLDMPLERVFRIHVPNAGLTRIRVDGRGADTLARLVFHAGEL